MLAVLLKKRYWLLLILLLTPVLVIERTPAQFAVAVVQRLLPNFAVAGISGRLWRGTIASAHWSYRGHSFPLGAVQWRLQGASLVRLSPCLQFSSAHAAQVIKGKACYSLLSGRLSVSDLDAAIPVASVTPLLQVDIGGHIDAYIDSAVWEGQQLSAVDASVLWNKAAMHNGSEWIPLGDLQASVSSEPDGQFVSRWRNVSSGQPSPVALQLTVVVTELTAPQPRFKVTGSIQPGPQARALQPMLQFIGERTAAGAYRIAIDE
ncbi:MAG: type II secretion system protein N [Cellvibrionaceae bacterium]|nr:type II secretion system protein N [Cellvibrionaceae bacterium]